ncbi:MAG: hypothetical protein ACOYNS_04770 [Bacteroidota bacterium]
MSYSVEVEQKEEYLHAFVNGESTLANVNASFNEIYGACILYRCNNVLVENHLAGKSLDSMEMFDFIKKNYVKANSLGMRIAFIDMVREHDLKALKFGENLALISGVNIRLFTELNEDEMVSWLLER